MKKEIRVFKSYAEQEKADIEYYMNLDPDKKIEELENIRNTYLDMINATTEERKLQKVIKRRAPILRRKLVIRRR